MPETLSCLTCRRAFRVKRGNCDTCYKRHAEAVRAGRASCGDLERRGLAEPTDGRGRNWMAGFDKWLRAGK
jgi:hypothetical protein